MAELGVNPARIAHLAVTLRNADTKARVLKQRFAGALGATPSPLALDVGGTTVEIPSGASIRVWADGQRPGIEITSDSEPAPPGMWLRIECAATRQANEVFADLAQLGEPPEAPPHAGGITEER